MAAGGGVLTEDQFLCPICLDVFNQPVSTPCGHNFCLSCLMSYWRTALASRCPVCKETFHRRPDLKVNTFIAEFASRFRFLQLSNADLGGGGGAEPQQAEPDGGPVPCDVCADGPSEAVRSCLECQTSYCHDHLEPHRRAAGLKRHTLIEPVALLEERTCRVHSRLLLLFCRKEGVLLCDLCASSHHVRHEVLPVHQARVEIEEELPSTRDTLREMIQRRLGKVHNMKESVEQSKVKTEILVGKNVEELTELVLDVQKNQAALIEAVEKKQKAKEEEADGAVGDLEREIAELRRAADDLEKLSRMKDHVSFLRRFKSLSLVPDNTTDLSTLGANRHLETEHIHKSVSRAASRMRAVLNQMSTEIRNYSEGRGVSNAATLRYMQQYEVDVVLDPDTAHPLLVLSGDGKKVRYSMDPGPWGRRAPNPNMFTEHLAVLGVDGFSSCKFYFEVFVGEKTEWCLGVAAASVERRGALGRNAHSGLWAIWFLEDRIETFNAPERPVYLGKVERVGVFVDYDEGEISFYDVTDAEPIYSFTDCDFGGEELHPYFNPCDDEFGSNLGPMVIVPVCFDD